MAEDADKFRKQAAECRQQAVRAISHSRRKRGYGWLANGSSWLSRPGSAALISWPSEASHHGL
jgi:hypothetical protein